MAVNYKGSLVEECSVDAIVVDQLLILVSHLLIFHLITFKRDSNEVIIMWKKFLNPSPDLYSKFSKSTTSSRTRSFIKTVMLYFFFAWRLGWTQTRHFQNLQTFSTIEIIAAEAISRSSSSSSDIFLHSDFKRCAKPTVVTKIHELSVNLNYNYSSWPWKVHHLHMKFSCFLILEVTWNHTGVDMYSFQSMLINCRFGYQPKWRRTFYSIEDT